MSFPPTSETDSGERLISPNFITEVVEKDLKTGRYSTVVTRFPPEPNGYPHIGHAFASFIDFGIAQQYGGRCHLRMDDTNPEKESMEYVEAIIRDMRWLGWDWQEHLYFASDYYERFYELAVRLIKLDKAYVDSLSEEEIQAYRGSVTEPGRESPYRHRSVEENLDLFERMKAGEFPNGAHVLRAKIDMRSPNMKLRDPVLYRILHLPHYRTGERWCIYPMYDFAHPLSDAIEGVTHSLCSLEFVENRAIYDWLMETLFEAPRPYQYEFGRRSLEYTVVSKRKLIRLVEECKVAGWDDPRMPTLAGLRRRGVTPEAIRNFASRIGISRTNRTVDIALLEYAIRDDLNTKAPRVMAVLEPLKVILTNYTESGETLDAPYWPPDVPNSGSRPLPFSGELYIEHSDFAEAPPKGFKRLSPGEHVRLRYAYVIRCDEVIKDVEGNICELRCSYYPDSLGSNPEGIKVKGAIHWLSAPQAIPAEFRLYDRLFRVPNPDEGDDDFMTHLNPESLVTRQGFIEPSVLEDAPETRYQFERQGYFWRDPQDSQPDKLVFNRIVTLKDSWNVAQKMAEVPVKKAEGGKLIVAAKPGEVRDPVLDFNDEQKRKLESLLHYDITRDDAVLLAETPKLAEFFEAAVSHHANPQGIANWLINELRRELPEGDPAALPFDARAVAALVKLIDDGVITSRIAKDVLADMLASGKSPAAIVEAKNLRQLDSKAALLPIIEKLIAENPDKVSAYREGKTGLIGFFIGQVMRQTQGKANPQLLETLLKDKLGS
jgi:glutaminyl-tRNA synthetase